MTNVLCMTWNFLYPILICWSGCCRLCWLYARFSLYLIQSRVLVIYFQLFCFLSLPFARPKKAICGDKIKNCTWLLHYNSFISIHSEITSLQLLKRWIRVSSCNLQKEHKGEGDFPKRNSILLRCDTLLSILYWKALTCDSTYILGQKVY